MGWGGVGWGGVGWGGVGWGGVGWGGVGWGGVGGLGWFGVGWGGGLGCEGRGGVGLVSVGLPLEKAAWVPSSYKTIARAHARGLLRTLLGALGLVNEKNGRWYCGWLRNPAL